MFCGEEEVGTCDFDLATYIGLPPKPEAAPIRAVGYQGRAGKNYLLSSNPDAWPNSEIQFRLSVSDPSGGGSATKDTAGRRESVMITGDAGELARQLTRSGSIANVEQEEKLKQMIE